MYVINARDSPLFEHFLNIFFKLNMDNPNYAMVSIVICANE